MHTAFDLKKEMFSARRTDEVVDPYALLDWGPLDRLGVVIDRPVGALGAGLLTLLAACAFYDCVPKRRRRPIYPEIYLFHVGGPWGIFINFDFWPDHKEVFVQPDAREMLRAINNRGITHLVVPDGALQPVEHRFKEPETAHDRLKCCYVYGIDGGAADGDVTLSTTAMDVLGNYEGVLEIDHFLANVATAQSPIPLRLRSKSEEENRLGFELVAARVAAELRKDDPTHVAARRRIDAARASGELRETYRRISVDEALMRLV